MAWRNTLHCTLTTNNHHLLRSLSMKKYRKRRDELSHNVFLMLQETNKFREHQSREILIEILEKQLAERQALLEELEDGIERADSLLGHMGSIDTMETN